MKFLIIFAAFLIFTVKSESCGNLNQSANQWPWTVSIFFNASNMVLCQGSIISNKHILTAGHCLQHKSPSNILVYPGFVSHRRIDNHQMIWQVEHINLHPEMKLTSRGRFINGGFVASRAIHADLAIATLKHEIQFNDIITSVCMPIDDSIENIEIHGSYSGWNMNVRNVELLNATIEAIGDAEIIEVAVDEKRVDFVTGTGLYSQMNSSWMIIGLMTMRDNDNQNGTDINKFISIHKYVNWITNHTRTSTSSSIETSTASFDSSSTQTSKLTSNGNLPILSIKSTQNPSSLSNNSLQNVEISNQGGSTLFTTKIVSTTFSPTTQNLSNDFTDDKALSSGGSQTNASEITSEPNGTTTDNPLCPATMSKKQCLTIIRRKKTTTEPNETKIIQDSTPSIAKERINFQKSTSSVEQTSESSTLSPKPTSTFSTIQKDTTNATNSKADNQKTPLPSTQQIEATTVQSIENPKNTVQPASENSTRKEISSPATNSAISTTISSQMSTIAPESLQSTKTFMTEPSSTSQEKETSSPSKSSITQTTVTSKAAQITQPSSSDADTTTENSISTQSSLISAPAVTSTTSQKLISTLETKVENSTPLISTGTDESKIETTTANESTSKASSINDSLGNDISTTIGLNMNVDSVTEIPKIIASNLQAVYNRSLVPRLPEGRDLKDFSNNVSQAIEGLSTIANRLPSIILTTLETTKRNSVEEEIITASSIPALNSILNITNEAGPSIMNSTESNDNSTTTISSEDLVIGGIDFSPAMVITGICIASMLVLFTVFGLLSLSKPIAHPH